MLAGLKFQRDAVLMPGPMASAAPPWSTSEAQEEGVATLRTVRWVVLVVKVQDVLLSLKAKPLVQQHGGVARRHVQRHVLPHACLKGRGRHSEVKAVTS